MGNRLFYEEDESLPQSTKVELKMLKQYWVKIGTNEMFNSEPIECAVDIEAQFTAKETIASIKRYISAHYYDKEFTIISMCKL